MERGLFLVGRSGADLGCRRTRVSGCTDHGTRVSDSSLGRGRWPVAWALPVPPLPGPRCSVQLLR